MAKAYVCDACGLTIKNPHDVKMKEFYVGVTFDFGHAFPINTSRTEKVHLCDDCYHALNEIARRDEDG